MRTVWTINHVVKYLNRFTTDVFVSQTGNGRYVLTDTITGQQVSDRDAYTVLHKYNSSVPKSWLGYPDLVELFGDGEPFTATNEEIALMQEVADRACDVFPNDEAVLAHYREFGMKGFEVRFLYDFYLVWSKGELLKEKAKIGEEPLRSDENPYMLFAERINEAHQVSFTTVMDFKARIEPLKKALRIVELAEITPELKDSIDCLSALKVLRGHTTKL